MDSLATGDVFLCFIKAGWVGLGVARETSVALPCFQVSRCHLWMRHEVISMQNVSFFKALIFSFLFHVHFNGQHDTPYGSPKNFGKQNWRIFIIHLTKFLFITENLTFSFQVLLRNCRGRWRFWSRPPNLSEIIRGRSLPLDFRASLRYYSRR